MSTKKTGGLAGVTAGDTAICTVGVDGTGVASRLISPSQLPPTVN